MNRIFVLVIFFSFSLVLHRTHSVEVEVKNSLIIFLAKISNGVKPGLSWGWNPSSDPCKDHWQNVDCDSLNTTVTKLFLNGQNLTGAFDAASLCNTKPLAASLTTLALDDNNIAGQISGEIGHCNQLTQFTVSNNRLSGTLPESLTALNNLKTLDFSNNQLTGLIPNFDFSHFDKFNVSNNKFQGPIPNTKGFVQANSFVGNSELCGDPLANKCLSSSLTTDGNSKNSKGVSKNQVILYIGYAILALVFIVLLFFKICTKNKKEAKKVDAANKVSAVDESVSKISAASSEFKGGLSKSNYSVTMSDDESQSTNMVLSSLIVLTSPVVDGLKFEDLLRAPAELLGRGKYGSLYKVIFEEGMVLVVKRIDWAISGSDFKKRMERLYQAKHQNVLPVLAFYSSKQEKLLVYEYQENGSLFRLIHGSHRGQAFDWSSRLSVAARIAEALAFMHKELRAEGIAHGNLKSSNVLLNNKMEPCISEYGLMVIKDLDNQTPRKASRTSSTSSAFNGDIYGFGVILLELLTGKLVQHNGVDLTVWVHSVVREEWTAEVFDQTLMSEYASEERMVNLLQVAIKCVNRSAEARPSMDQVAIMINTIIEEEERSRVFDPQSSMSLI
ncbi:probable inactive receptor kinase At2g26730 [Pyrus x bretschneideri]|uniref:probable inactive receptor kinase At2g26730 n=1 Tax=Pyrus x bretschneideri TaxID=225117 RepID=UPI00202DF201|nr:probable inactive receptor kinase At2g26730 [Pyrus x bretschneideri]